MQTEHEVLQEQFEDLEQQHEASTLGMWTFLATEVLFFGVIFTGYTVYRLSYPEEFRRASQHLYVTLGGPNTLVLITSSLTMALAVRGAQVGSRRTQLTCLALTMLLGLIFLGVKFTEYYIEYRAALIPVLRFDETPWAQQGLEPAHVKLFFVFYFIMTGLHAVHMIIGIALLGVLLVLAGRSWFSPVWYTPVEMVGLYWHFVDVIWIFLLPLLYLIGQQSLRMG